MFAVVVIDLSVVDRVTPVAHDPDCFALLVPLASGVRERELLSVFLCLRHHDEPAVVLFPFRRWGTTRASVSIRHPDSLLTPLPASPDPPGALGGLLNIKIAIPGEVFNGRASREPGDGSIATSPSQQEQPLPAEDGRGLVFSSLQVMSNELSCEAEPLTK